MSDSPKTQYPDPRARRRALSLVGAGAVAGAAAIWSFKAYGSDAAAWITRDPDRLQFRLRLAFVVLALLFALPQLAAAGYLWRLGARTVRADRFPPPGTFLVRDVVVVSGADARRRARVLQLAAGAFVAISVAFTLLLWRLVTLVDARISVR